MAAFGGRELPDDLTADVLRRLPPRSLAVSRCVCRVWRDFVDGRRLLRADLLPLSVGGIFLNYHVHYSPEFMARPTPPGRLSIAGDLDFIPGFNCSKVLDHCNGHLRHKDDLSSDDCVINPATRRWAQLPPRRPIPTPLPQMGKRKRKKGHHDSQIKCLVYDPTVSSHYEVLLIHPLRHQHRRRSALRVDVYSSVTGRWEERLFAPEGHVVEKTKTIGVFDRYSRVYWRGALYLLRQDDGFVLRVSISDAKYRLIPVPADVGFSRSRESLSYGSLSLGRSEKGVYCASDYDRRRLRIFLLNESSSSDQSVWELKHSVDFTTFSRKLHALKDHSDHQQNGPWVLQETNYYRYPCVNDKRREVVEERFEWNSDDDNVLSTEDMVEGHSARNMHCLGFHPYKEIVILDAALSTAVAYHWNTSKFQDLGNICPKEYHCIAGDAAGIDTSFIYTPCWIDTGFPEDEKEENKSVSAKISTMLRTSCSQKC